MGTRRVVRDRHSPGRIIWIVPPTDINALLERQIAGRSFGVFGEPRVNVLDLNLALQRAYPRPR